MSIPVLETKYPTNTLKSYLKRNFTYEHRSNDVSVPKIEYVTDEKFDDRVSSIKMKMTELHDRYNSNIDRSQKLEIKSEYSKLTDKLNDGKNDVDCIRISQLKFIKDFETAFNSAKQSDNISDYICDYQLRGLIDMFSKTTTKPEQDELVEKLIDQLDLCKIDNMFRNVKEDFNSILSNIDSFRIKFFNMCFDGFETKKKSNVKTHLRLGCAKNMYPRFDELFYSYLQTQSRDDMIDVVLEGNKFRSDALRLVDSKSFKGFDKELVEAIKLIRSTSSCYDFLSKHDLDNLKEHYPKYIKLVNEFKSIQRKCQLNSSCKTVIDLVNTVITCGRLLKSLDNRPVTNTLNVFFINEFLSIEDIILNPSIKNKLIDLTNSTDEFKFDEHFTEDDFKPFVKNNLKMYDINVYDKLGMITQVKQPKNIRIALGFRLIIESLHMINVFRLNHKGKKFTVTIRC